MKIAVAQIKSFKGEIGKNGDAHKKLIAIAASNKVNAIFFPELSLSGYEPELATSLAIDLNDARLNDFQISSDRNNITIGLGVPTKSTAGILISMLIFQPGKSCEIYSKRYLHEDEFPYFVPGNNEVILTVGGVKIAPAICYESLLSVHAEASSRKGADIYLASVAKPQGGIDKAFKHYPEIAKKYSMPVLMSNCIGFCDNFESAGRTSVWNNQGFLTGQLDDKSEGILIFDTKNDQNCISVLV